MKEVEPLAIVRELRPDCKYLISVPNYFRFERIDALARELQKNGVSAMIISGQEMKLLAINFETVRPEPTKPEPAKLAVKA